MSPEQSRLLIVDDDPELLRFLIEELSGAGHQCSGCDNGQDALLRWYACKARVCNDKLLSSSNAEVVSARGKANPCCFGSGDRIQHQPALDKTFPAVEPT